MFSYDRVLVPVDGSDGAERAIEHAVALARTTGASVDFVHVAESGGLRSVEGAIDTDVARERSETILSSARRPGDDAGVDVTTERREGRPYEEILAYAEERGSDLVVMGRRAEADPGTRLLGGVTDKVIRSGERPVLVVPAGSRTDPGGYERILLPTDGSEPASAAVQPCGTLADDFGATVHVVNAVDVEGAGGLFDAGGVREEFVEDLESRGEAAVSEVVERVSAVADPPVETAVVRGRPDEALGDYVEAKGIDLVVMGAHGRSGVKRWMLGSVTERLLRTVDVPLLVVPESAETG